MDLHTDGGEALLQLLAAKLDVLEEGLGDGEQRLPGPLQGTKRRRMMSDKMTQWHRVKIRTERFESGYLDKPVDGAAVDQ